MHGIVMKGLKDYVVANYDRGTWRSVQDHADVERRLYTPVAQYPDRHGIELADAARSLTGADPGELEFEVGRHLVPTLLQVYGVHVRGVHSGLDVLANAEAVVVRYGGDHCAGLRGVVAGLGDHYGEDYAVVERACAREGADRCELVVRCPDAPGGAAASDD